MLKELRITNLILVESACIPFEEGLNMITGETGSGKSALLAALSLATGERADAGMIRRGAEKGSVEASFEIQALPLILHLLDSAGIQHNVEDALIIKREITVSGKGRAYINHQPVQVSLLKLIGQSLLEIAGQHAHTRLKNLEEHRRMVDLYSNLIKDVSRFAVGWEQESRLRRELEAMVLGEAQRLRDIEICRMEIEEIEEAALKDGEDEELFAEYSLLANAQERTAHAHDALQGLNATATLARSRNALEQLAKIDISLKETAELLNTALIELDDVSYTLRNYVSHIDHDPERSEKINDRLTLIAKLKRKYGDSVDAMNEYLGKQKERLDSLENADAKIDELRTEIQAIEEENNRRAQELSQARKESAKRLQTTLTEELRALNMPKATVEIDVTAQDRNKNGDDRIEIFLIPNVGEHRIPIRECASGGELSRVMLALHTLLAGKELTPTIVFDEIDANIGGETAVVIGQKLKEIGGQHQLICITHFAQVAKQADHHIKIYKEERDGRTLTDVVVLLPELRHTELARMQGEKVVVSSQ